MQWQPSASISHLRQRAHINKQIRDFFAERQVMEVETPLMCHTSVTDPFIQSIPALFQSPSDTKEQRYYLQTSPEYAMKRLLAAGSGCIYQITKAFRQGEVGRFHNPEFTMLEWYRINFDHYQLMDEVDAFLQLTLQTPAAQRKSYAELFQTYLDIDPHTATLNTLKNSAEKLNLHIEADIQDRDSWLTILMSHHIEPQLGQDRPCFVYDFPASQAALARIQDKQPPVASRFEVYYHGIELANGFHELQNAPEQRSRFENNLKLRREQNSKPLPIDEFFLAALEHGLPDCAGIAIGIDRLVMLATQTQNITDVISFDFSRC